MLGKTITASLCGVVGELILVEADLSRGIPSYGVVGLADTAIKEGGYRIKAAMNNGGFEFPRKKITINLSPADYRKKGTHFDLPIAIAIIFGQTGIPIKEKLKREILDFGIIGELSLDGTINPIKGALPLVLAMKQNGIKKIILPLENCHEVCQIEDIEYYGVEKISEILEWVFKGKPLALFSFEKEKEIKNNFELDYNQIVGQLAGIRGMEICAAGDHGVLLVGRPGIGKTMLAKRLPTILPEMSFEEKVQVTTLYSVSGLLGANSGLIAKRPFRAPHHTTTRRGILGGGRRPTPGEISLAHCGVLFLDEMALFDSSVLDGLRQPIEEGAVSINRGGILETFPSKAVLVGATNPCKCGFLGDSKNECTCTTNQINNYRAKLLGPLLDRIDLIINLEGVDYKDIRNYEKRVNSIDIKKRVNLARQIQKERYKNLKEKTNGRQTSEDISKYSKMDLQSQHLLQLAYKKYELSVRSYYKIIKIARTIADLEESEVVKEEHMLEAIQYGKGNSNS